MNLTPFSAEAAPSLGETAAITATGSYGGASGSQVTAHIATASIDIAAIDSEPLGIKEAVFANSLNETPQRPILQNRGRNPCEELPLTRACGVPGPTAP